MNPKLKITNISLIIINLLYIQSLTVSMCRLLTLATTLTKISADKFNITLFLILEYNRLPVHHIVIIVECMIRWTCRLNLIEKFFRLST